MPPLPRGKCPDCHRDVAVRAGGEAREHQVYNRTTGRYEKCGGSGKKAER